MGHWYDKDGKPQHFTTMANGNSRGTTLRDARKHGYLPSVTEIINTLDKPALTNWKLRQVTQAAYGRIPTEGQGQGDYHSVLMSEAFKQSTEARDRGSEIHDAIEGIFLRQPPSNPDHTIIDIALNAFDAILDYINYEKINDLIPEQTVVGDGYGGMVDLHNDDFVIDWKTKDIDDISKKLAYPEQAMQLAAYDKALPMVSVNRRCINVFIDRTEPGKVVIYEWSPEDIEINWKKFQLLVKYWQLDKNYFPGES